MKKYILMAMIALATGSFAFATEQTVTSKDRTENIYQAKKKKAKKKATKKSHHKRSSHKRTASRK